MGLRGPAKAMERWTRRRAKFREVHPGKIIEFEGRNIKAGDAIKILSKRLKDMKKLLEE